MDPNGHFADDATGKGAKDFVAQDLLDLGNFSHCPYNGKYRYNFDFRN